METKQLGNSDMQTARLGVGAWAMGGGDWAFAWGPQDDDDSIAAIRAAVEAGLNWVDTAAVYGLAIPNKWWGKRWKASTHGLTCSPSAPASGARIARSAGV